MGNVGVKVNIDAYVINEKREKLYTVLECLDGQLYVPNVLFKVVGDLDKNLDEGVPERTGTMTLPFSKKAVNFTFLYLYNKIYAYAEGISSANVPWKDMTIPNFIDVISLCKFLNVTEQMQIDVVENILNYFLDFHFFDFFMEKKMGFKLTSARKVENEFYFYSRKPMELLERLEEVKKFTSHIKDTMIKLLDDKTYKLPHKRLKNRDDAYNTDYEEMVIPDLDGEPLTINNDIEKFIIRDYVAKKYDVDSSIMVKNTADRSNNEIWHEGYLKARRETERNIETRVNKFFLDQDCNFEAEENRKYNIGCLYRFLIKDFEGKFLR